MERMGNVSGALAFYRGLVDEAPESDEAREAAGRIGALSP
jgi:hypothetical protein